MNNPVIIRRRVDRDFTVIRNDIYRDSRLSWKALGLLTYLLHLPSDWRLYLAHLSEQRSDKRDSTRAGLRELEAAGYLTITRERDVIGQYKRTVWMVTDTPSPPLTPSSNEPSSDFSNAEESKTVTPHVDTPAPVNPTLLNTNGTKKYKNQDTTTTKRNATRDGDQRFNPNSVLALNMQELRQSPPYDNVIYPALSLDEVKYLADVIEKCPNEWRQSVLDEVEGQRRIGFRKSALGFARALVHSVLENKFTPSLGVEIAKERERRKKTERVIASSSNAISTFTSESISSETLAMLPPTLRRKYEEAVNKIDSKNQPLPSQVTESS